MNSPYLKIIIDGSYEDLTNEQPEFAAYVDHHENHPNATTTIEIVVAEQEYFFAQDDEMIHFLTRNFETISCLGAKSIEAHFLAWDGKDDFTISIEPELLGILAGLSACIVVHTMTQ